MKKKLLSVLLCIAVTAAMTGCGSSGQEPAAETAAEAPAEEGAEAPAQEESAGGESYTIATVVKDMSDPWCLRH